jgi:hypothetical protein
MPVAKKNTPESGLTPLRRFLITVAVFTCLACALPCYGQEGPWYEPFFVETAVQYYFTPGLFSDLLEPDAGVRAALGYEYRRFRFALESGYTHITGTNPLVLDFKFTPLTFKAGYALPLGRGWGLQADLSLGRIFSRTVHYDTAIDMLLGKKRETRADSFLTGVRFYGTYSFLRGQGGTQSLKLYAGGGIDAIFENEGTIPLPLIEAGISFKPLVLIRPKQTGRGRAGQTPSGETERPPEFIDASWESYRCVDLIIE